ncbi:MAG: hypothetical protein ACYCV7_14985 [Acidimicrobiales bacterium]
MGKALDTKVTLVAGRHPFELARHSVTETQQVDAVLFPRHPVPIKRRLPHDSSTPPSVTIVVPTRWFGWDHRR